MYFPGASVRYWVPALCWAGTTINMLLPQTGYTVYHSPEISETLEKVSVSTTFAQSRLVSVSTSLKIIGLNESRSRQL